jgi:uncharacterized protein
LRIAPAAGLRRVFCISDDDGADIVTQWCIVCWLALGLVHGHPISPAMAQPPAAQVTHPVRYFEIPVTNMNRAVEFYSAVLDTDFERQIIDGYEMALFPFDETAPGATGALAKGDVYVPSKTGTIIYFTVTDIDITLRRATERGGKILYAKKDVGTAGFVAEIEDSEGNRIALMQSKGAANQ